MYYNQRILTTTKTICIKSHSKLKKDNILQPTNSHNNKSRMETPIHALPRELVIEILGRVASASFEDLHSAKRSCKSFFEVAEEDAIYQRVSLERFSMVQWHDDNHRISNFLDVCRRSKNSEALFRKGVVDYFGGIDPNNAIKCLEEAANSGHEDASYTLAIVLLFGKGELKQRGIKLLSEMKKSRIKKKKINNYRWRLKNILKSIWIKNATVLNQPRPTFCSAHHKRRRSGWDGDEEVCEEDNVCDGCFCDEEIAPIYNVLPQIVH